MERLQGVGQSRLRIKKTATVADVQKIIDESGSTLNMSRLAQVVLAEFGGAERLGRELRKEFDSAKPGSTARSNAIKSVMALINLGAPKSNVNDVSNLSEADLEKVIQGMLAKVQNPGGGSGEEESRGPETGRAAAGDPAAGQPGPA